MKQGTAMVMLSGAVLSVFVFSQWHSQTAEIEANLWSAIPTSRVAPGSRPLVHSHSQLLAHGGPLHVDDLREADANTPSQRSEGRFRRPLAAATGAVTFLASAPAALAAEGSWLPDWVPSLPAFPAWAAELGMFGAKTAIVLSIPAGIVLFLIVSFKQSQAKAAAEGGGGMNLMSFFQPAPDPNKIPGAPKEYLKIERVNDFLESYRFTFKRTTEGPLAAVLQKRRQEFERRFSADLAAGLTDDQIAALSAADQAWVRRRANTQKMIDDLSAELRAQAVASAGPMGTGTGTGEKKQEKKGPMLQMPGQDKTKAMRKQVDDLLKELAQAELDYIAQVSKSLNPEQRKRLQELLKTTGPKGWQSRENVLALSPEDQAGNKAKNVFVMKFFGDIQAAQVKQLRQEVTAVLSNAKPERGDEVVLILNSGGGTVTGYGLAAAQLKRIKDKGLKLTICVEEVAASGGYMMACTADRLVASPFAVLGSIGVITDMPNVYDRLQKEGIEFITTTAGKYKRTLTPTKKPTEEDKAKVKEDIEQILVLFKKFVASERLKLNIEEVATGETWFGPDAKERGLCDELKTSDDVLLEFLDEGAEIYNVTFKKPVEGIQKLLAPQGTSDVNGLWRLALARLLLGSTDSLSPLPGVGPTGVEIPRRPPAGQEYYMRYENDVEAYYANDAQAYHQNDYELY